MAVKVSKSAKPAGKTCPGCGSYKMYDNYAKNRSRDDGLQSHCKECFKNFPSQRTNGNGGRTRAGKTGGSHSTTIARDRVGIPPEVEQERREKAEKGARATIAARYPDIPLSEAMDVYVNEYRVLYQQFRCKILADYYDEMCAEGKI